MSSPPNAPDPGDPACLDWLAGRTVVGIVSDVSGLREDALDGGRCLVLSDGTGLVWDLGPPSYLGVVDRATLAPALQARADDLVASGAAAQALVTGLPSGE